jgi:predicted AAA+ superfamily ATPase
LYNYIDYAKNAFLLMMIQRQDLVGKVVLSSQEKIYLTDHGMRQALYGFNTRDIGQILENIVCLELRRRGYDVTVGKNVENEVDFCCANGNDISSYQVAYLLASPETTEREFGAFRRIKDNYPRYVLSLDEFDFSQNGIIHKNIIDWLLEYSLEE